MRFHKLDLNLLVALDALIDVRSVTKAADRVHLSQSSMSNSLAKLREYFDDELLVQVGRKMELTPRAEALRDPVRDILVRVESSIALQPSFDPTTSDRQFTLCISDYTQMFLMPHVLSLAMQQGSTVRFKLLPQIDNPALELERGSVDMLCIPEEFSSRDHPAETVFTESFECVAWEHSRIAREELTRERYLDAEHIVMQPPGTTRLAFEAWLMEQHGITRRVGVTSYSFNVMPYLVVGTEYLATVHSRLAHRTRLTAPIVVLRNPYPLPPLTQVIQWHKYRTSDPGIMWLRDLMKSAATMMDPTANAS